MNKLENRPILTFEAIAGWVIHFLAAVGIMAVAALIGLYQAGFFNWATAEFTGNAVLQFFFAP